MSKAAIDNLGRQLVKELGNEFTLHSIFGSKDDLNKVPGTVYNLKIRYYSFRVLEPIYVNLKVFTSDQKIYPLDIKIQRTRRMNSYWRSNNTFSPQMRFKYKEPLKLSIIETYIKKLLAGFLILELDNFSDSSFNYIARLRR